MQKKNVLWFLLVIFLSIFSFKSLLRPGYFPMHDDMQIIRVVEMDKCIKDGQIPCRWVPDLGYGYGYPLYNYYGSSSYYVMEIFHLLGNSIIDSIKIEMILSVLLSALGMFLLGRSLWGNLGGLISAVFYIYAPYRAIDIFSRGAVGEFTALIFLPFIFWGILEYLRQGQKKYFLIISLSLAGLLATHNITSLIFIPFIGLWSVLLVWQFKKWGQLKNIIGSLFLGFCLAGFFIIPALLEKPLAHTESMISGYFNYLAHFISINQLFLSTHWGYGPSEFGPYDDTSFSIGFFHWFFALLALIIAIFKRKDRFTFFIIFFLGLSGLFSAFMAHEKSSFIWNIVPMLEYLQFPWRFLSLIIFFFSVTCGAIVNFSKKSGLFLASTMIVLVLLVNGNYFRPESWKLITDKDKLTGIAWEKQVTASIFDYLPIYAKAPPAKAAPEIPWAIEGDIKVLEYRKGTDWQQIKIQVVSKTAIVRIPQFYFPDFVVKVDGKSAPIDYKNDLGLITFSANAGLRDVSLKLNNSLVRSVGNLLTFGGFLFIIGWEVYDRKNKKTD